MKKKISWIDSVRVLATLMIIFAHYFMCVEFSKLTTYLHFALSYDVAIFSVSLFLVISGYLVPSSLQRSTNFWQFYKRKLIRVIVPFIVSYILLTAVLILPAIFEAPFSEKIPLIYFMRDKNLLPMILGMFPVDLNLIKFLGLEIYWFVGEWFMGTLLWLYLLSPLLYKAATKFPIASQIISIAIACAVYYMTQPLEAQGIILESWTLFIVRVPEFLFGMILFTHRYKIQKIRLSLSLIFITGVFAYVFYFVMTLPPGGTLFFPTNPCRFILLLPMIYLLFVFAELLNSSHIKFLARFNGLSDMSYIAMIIQHVIIYVFVAVISFDKLGILEAFVVLSLITLTIFKVSKVIKYFSEQILCANN